MERRFGNTFPNSPISIRPILSLPENEDNVYFLMDTMINEETALVEENGLKLANGLAKVTIRSMFDSTMGKILSGAGGACCQLCTATFMQIHDKKLLVKDSPLIERYPVQNLYSKKLMEKIAFS